MAKAGSRRGYSGPLHWLFTGLEQHPPPTSSPIYRDCSLTSSMTSWLHSDAASSQRVPWLHIGALSRISHPGSPALFFAWALTNSYNIIHLLCLFFMVCLSLLESKLHEEKIVFSFFVHLSVSESCWAHSRYSMSVCKGTDTMNGRMSMVLFKGAWLLLCDKRRFGRVYFRLANFF